MFGCEGVGGNPNVPDCCGYDLKLSGRGHEEEIYVQIK